MKKLIVMGALIVAVMNPAASLGQVSLGAQGSWGDRHDWALGGRLTVDLSPRAVPVAFIGSYDWFWPDSPGLIGDREYWEINANVVLVRSLYSAEVVSYIGGGLNVAHTAATGSIGGSPIDESDTRYGVNILGGTRYKFERLAPFAELRYIIEGGEQFVITVGLDLLFGLGY